MPAGQCAERDQASRGGGRHAELHTPTRELPGRLGARRVGRRPGQRVPSRLAPRRRAGRLQPGRGLQRVRRRHCPADRLVGDAAAHRTGAQGAAPAWQRRVQQPPLGPGDQPRRGLGRVRPHQLSAVDRGGRGDQRRGQHAAAGSHPPGRVQPASGRRVRRLRHERPGPVLQRHPHRHREPLQAQGVPSLRGPGKRRDQRRIGRREPLPARAGRDRRRRERALPRRRLRRHGAERDRERQHLPHADRGQVVRRPERDRQLGRLGRDRVARPAERGRLLRAQRDPGAAEQPPDVRWAERGRRVRLRSLPGHGRHDPRPPPGRRRSPRDLRREQRVLPLGHDAGRHCHAERRRGRRHLALEPQGRWVRQQPP